MRILDKYLLREFALPVLYCFDAFLLLWVVIDLIGHLDDFVEVQAHLGQAVRYYLIILPEALVQIVPMSLLLGLLFCLSNLAKHNELLAMRSSGVSRARLAGPLLLAGLVASLLVGALNELFVPGAAERAKRFFFQLRGRATTDAIENFFFADPLQHRDWYARWFRPERGEMEYVELHETRPDGTPTLDLYAASARWGGDSWHFYEAELYDHASWPAPATVTRVAETNFPALRGKPQQLGLEAKNPEHMSATELRRYARALRRSGRTAQLAEMRVMLHYRYAFPWTSLMVMWIGIPLGLQVSRRGPLLAVGASLILVVAFYFLTHISLALGMGGHLPPVLSAWLTNGAFLVVGAGLFARLP